MLSEDRLRDLAGRLVGVAGVRAVVLGGSRARGEEHPDSDVDLGLYYRPPLDVVALRRLASEVAGARGSATTTRPEPATRPDGPTESGTATEPGPTTDPDPVQITEPGAWGPWVDGGGWLSVDGTDVDWIYRDLDRVHRSWDLARAGRFEVHFQVGHPLGVPDFAYAGEVALGVVLADPDGELAALQADLHYPDALSRAGVGRLDEARFLLGALAKPAGRGDTAFLAGTLFRVVGLCAHALHAASRRWVITEKGLVDAAGRLPLAPAGFSSRCHGLLGRLGTEPARLRAALAEAGTLTEEVAVVCAAELGRR